MSLESLEAAMDPTRELSKLVLEGKFEEAFTKVLCMSDVAMVAWLCSQVSDACDDVAGHEACTQIQ